MTEGVITVAADARLARMVTLMEQHPIKRVPFLGDTLIGTVSRADLLRALVDAFRQDGAKAADDVQNTQKQSKALDREEWSPSAIINSSVEKASPDRPASRRAAGAIRDVPIDTGGMRYQ